MPHGRKTITPKHRLEYTLFRCAETTLRCLPVRFVYHLGRLTGRLAHKLTPKRRSQVLRNLRLAYGSEKTSRELEKITHEVYQRTGANFLCSLRVPFLSDRQLSTHLELSGLDELQETAKKSGVVLVTCHMGNWEILPQALDSLESSLAVGTHYRALNNQLIDNVIQRRRKRRGLRLFAKASSTYQMTTFVRDGGILGILADQKVGSRGFAGTFFGRPTTSSPLPHLIAARSHARLISLHCETIGPAKWRACFHPISEVSGQACADAVEKSWRSSPEDVFWFEERWRLRGPHPLAFLKKISPHLTTPRPLNVLRINHTPLPDDIPAELLSFKDVNFTLETLSPTDIQTLKNLLHHPDAPIDLIIAPKDSRKLLKPHLDKVYLLEG